MLIARGGAVDGTVCIQRPRTRKDSDGLGLAARVGHVPRARILHVAQPVWAGLANAVASILADQVSLGMDVALACPPYGELPPLADDIGVERYDWDATRSPGLSTVGECRRFASVLRRAKPDLVHLHASKAGLVGRLVIRGRLGDAVPAARLGLAPGRGDHA